MSVLASYREKEEMLRKLTEDLNRMKENPELQKELDFKEEINAVLVKYQRNANDLATIFALTPVSGRSVSGRGNRTKRKLKIYVNPNSNETIETRGGNHRILKQWKAQYGSDTVESWLREERD